VHVPERRSSKPAVRAARTPGAAQIRCGRVTYPRALWRARGAVLRASVRAQAAGSLPSARAERELIDTLSAVWLRAAYG